MRGDSFLRTALVALDETGDPARVRGAIESAPAPGRGAARPAGTLKRIAWAANQLATFADDPARAYAALRELVGAMFEPLATHRRAAAPAPEVALALVASPGGHGPTALLDALAPAPRVLAREVAIAAGLDSAELLADANSARRVLGVRSISSAKLGRFADALAERIAADPDPIVRAEVLEVCAPAHGKVRAKIAAALAEHVDHIDADTRVNALDGLRALKLPLADARLAKRLADRDAAVRAAAARSVTPNPSPEVGDAVIGRLADADPSVRAAALDAVARCPSLHHLPLVAPLRTLVRRHDGDTRTAIYLLGKLRGTNDALILATLHDAIAGPRSDAARAAALVLTQFGESEIEVPVETRLLRAARELAASDRETQLAGLFEAARLGDAAKSLVPAIRRLGDMLSAVDDASSRATLEHVREVLGSLGVPPAELPQVRPAYEPWRGITPRERSVHGAYAIASVERDKGTVPLSHSLSERDKGTVPLSGLGLWDHATGALLFVVQGAELLELLPGRAEVGVIRIAHEAMGDAWFFERYRVPNGERIALLLIPEALTIGWPSTLAIAAGLVTVWCGDEDTPYRFHIKLGDPDRLLDDEPIAREPKRKRGSTKLPRRKAKNESN